MLFTGLGAEISSGASGIVNEAYLNQLPVAVKRYFGTLSDLKTQKPFNREMQALYVIAGTI